MAAPLDATASPARPGTSGHRARIGFWTVACLGVPAALFSWCWFGFAMAEAQSEQGKALAAGTTMAGFGEAVGGVPVAVAHVVGLIVLLVLAHRAYRGSALVFAGTAVIVASVIGLGVAQLLFGGAVFHFDPENRQTSVP
ncbi:MULTISPECIES: hypothetical protein [unclassified Rathayibacter]|uniref:hypothetical protein n=1 Tax=unclassified Rathayibacter TaxID=2609250 RepID=UPI001050D238|nr:MULTISPECIES: hypothetical protein [unclassified Rathayibacter]TCL78288.1 hypothetical protein EDF49_11331 [Rathayibacter sp. PhB192]TCM23891.1 hypothetical protein EDF43_11331 [Rathayibacter sp. PhB179]